MIHLRPHEVFDQVRQAERLVTLCLPRRESLTSVLEKSVLLSLVRIVRPKRIFEFGTCLGETSVAMAANSNARVYTLDLPAQASVPDAVPLDQCERRNLGHRRRELPVFEGTVLAARIEQLAGNSLTYDYSRFYGCVDFVLVDGGHQIEVVRNDTEEAMRMVSPRGLSCVVWHDYGNPHYEITDYLDDLSEHLTIQHVEETTYCFLLRDHGLDMSFQSLCVADSE